MCQCSECGKVLDCDPLEKPVGTHTFFTKCSQHKGMKEWKDDKR